MHKIDTNTRRKSMKRHKMRNAKHKTIWEFGSPSEVCGTLSIVTWMNLDNSVFGR